MLDAIGNVVLLGIVVALGLMGLIDVLMLVFAALANLTNYVRGKNGSGTPSQA